MTAVLNITLYMFQELGTTMPVDSLPRNYTKVPQHFNDKVYIQPRMIAQAKYTQSAGGETESENDTFTGTVCMCGELCVSNHDNVRFN